MLILTGVAKQGVEEACFLPVVSAALVAWLRKTLISEYQRQFLFQMRAI